MPRWNKDQQRAIDTRDRGVVVSAAAGSGKTAVLVERTISILSDCENRLPADKLLAVTFTNEAADQMRRKLGDALENKLRSSTSEQEIRWLSSQRDLLALARISTINSFCLDLVKRCLNEFEFEEGVRIIDEHDAEAVLAQSFEQALDEYAGSQRSDFDMLLDKLGSAYDITGFGKSLYSFLRSLPFPDEWMKRRLSELRNSSSLPNYLDSVFYKYNGFLDKAEKLNDRLRTNLGKYPEEDNNIRKNRAAAEADLVKINALRKAFDDGDWQKTWNVCRSGYETFVLKPRKNDSYPPALEALFYENADLRKKEKEYIKKISDDMDKLGYDIETPLKVSADVLERLYDFVKLAEQLAYKEKLKRNALEFSDVEIMALSLLVKRENGINIRTPFADELRRSGEYRLLLIDEFQDVNDLQELIFKSLSDTDDLDVFGSNVFVVGDVKQSIYGFRQSNPQLFIKARASASMKENESQLTLVELKSNYRSRGCIIDIVNMIFSQLMSEEIGEVEYVGGERLHQGAQYTGPDAPAEVIFVENTVPVSASAPVGEDDEAESSDDDGMSVDENYAIAKRIRQLIDEGTEIYDKDKDIIRPCVPRDFCILYRSSRSIESLKGALAAYGLKAAAEKSKGYLRSREISLMMSMLRMIDNPMRDIPMAAVMLSPILGFSADELARVRLLGKQQKTVTDENGKDRKSVFYKHLYQVISSVGQSDESSHEKESEKLEINDPVLEKKCAAAKALVRRLSFFSAGMDLPSLIRRIYDETELLAAVSSYENSRQKRANLRLLLEYARTYSENSDGTLAGFIRYIESISASGYDFTQATTEVEDDNSVLVKTIHASKGLEFPFVFLCGLTKQFNVSDLNDRLLLDEEYGAGLTLIDRNTLVKTETAAHSAVRFVKMNKLLSEELRLLYVAFTRARERIFLPINMKRTDDGTSATGLLISRLAGEISQAGGVTPRILRECKSYVQWIAAALLCGPNREPLRKEFGITCPLPSVPEKADIIYTDYVPDDLSGSDKCNFYQGSPDSAVVEELLTRFIRKQSAAEAPAASKMSVTEIVSAEKEEEQHDVSKLFFPQLPVLDDEKGSLTAAQRGTLTHLFMELADYSAAEKNVKDELARLTAQGFFTEKESRGVYVSAIEKFFEGAFYQRMKGSELMREKKFLVAFDDLDLPDKYRRYLSDGSMLQGVADCIFPEGDGYIIVDYKTDSFRDVSELYGYRTQLELYKAALDTLLDKPVKACYIYSFKLSLGAEIDLTVPQ